MNGEPPNWLVGPHTAEDLRERTLDVLTDRAQLYVLRGLNELANRADPYGTDGLTAIVAGAVSALLVTTWEFKRPEVSEEAWNAGMKEMFAGAIDLFAEGRAKKAAAAHG